jgi:uncharacterized protein
VALRPRTLRALRPAAIRSIGTQGPPRPGTTPIRIDAREEVLVSDAAPDGTYVPLGEPQCRALLARATLGRLAFTEGALPVVVPVPFALHDGHVVVATRHGSSMASAVRRAVVAFEVDSFSGAGQAGWAVTVVGPSRLVNRPSEARALDGVRRCWQVPAAARCYVAVRTDLVSGWRTTPASPSTVHPARATRPGPA